MTRTRSCAGTMSRCSLRSSSITCSTPPQQGQSRGSTSISTSYRGRCAGLAPRSRLVRGRGRRVLLGLVFRDGLLQILDPEQQLIGVQLFGAAAELMAQQALDQQLQLVDFG